MLVGTLPQVDRGEVESENLHRPHQRPQAGRRQGLGVVRTQRLLDHLQIGQELLRRTVRILRRHGVAQRLGTGQIVQRGRKAGVDTDQRTAVGLVFAVRVVVGRGFGHRPHGRRDRRQRGRDRQLAA